MIMMPIKVLKKNLLMSEESITNRELIVKRSQRSDHQPSWFENSEYLLTVFLAIWPVIVTMTVEYFVDVVSVKRHVIYGTKM